VLTDTTFWVDLLQERRRRVVGPAGRFLARHRAHELRVSIIVWGELAPGFDTSAELETVLHGVRMLPLPRHVAWEASRIVREMASAQLGENDTWIAATARAWGLRLVSRDGAFDRVPHLHRVPY